jgi:phosphatidylserine/phosphatidylglycerophosphate/cardiolipin synthase-like enzyme
MHGKALLVDGRDLLVTSANFTFHGTRANIEFGIRIKDIHVVEAASVFRALLQSDLLERVSMPR